MNAVDIHDITYLAIHAKAINTSNDELVIVYEDSKRMSDQSELAQAINCQEANNNSDAIVEISIESFLAIDLETLNMYPVELNKLDRLQKSIRHDLEKKTIAALFVQYR